ncbi:competence type IV pilus minor pilin ComGF [Jeotgalibacillus sp. HH7-29]|uniref:Competence type IV pilus minor pilin ComGF n=2 Tax=Jeotgalibacillus haloalkalitolerans TaxID=3104292 RepID=A0ABU5KMF6_9BACL|nr:competence type IV pilus minor pilin ComGF [Jeotgalibacillus sp. HH7-29]
MLEVLVSILVLAVIAPLFAMLMFSYMNLISIENHSKEWDMFSIQFQQEVASLMVESNTSQSITFIKDEAKVVFAKYGTILRKTVNGTGHEIHLTGLNHLNISRNGDLITMEVGFKNGTIKKSIFYTAPDE